MQNILNKIAAVKARVMQLYVNQDVIKAQTRRQESYELSEKVGKLLAYNIRQRATRGIIPAIKDTQGQIVQVDSAILEVFKDYYSALYQQENLSVTRCCIASDCLEPTPPSFNRWLARLSSMYYFEKSCYAIKGANRRRIGNSIWAPFARWLEASMV
ncbi:hypothetical protein NDU88_005066 [Pleurodeles waltl]|uniref:Reverse transcriptase n=1 Tax=Pleurodeles waltl TaxID=8319 RepID=A0AAV7WXR1_PLEWA|nr:hypothetical protein NDU88_005066 [Pleurodeles waltl]